MSGSPNWLLALVAVGIVGIFITNLIEISRYESDAYRQGYDAGYTGSDSGYPYRSEACEPDTGGKLGDGLVATPKERSEWKKGCEAGWDDAKEDE